MITTVLRNRGSRSARLLAEALGVGLATVGSVRHTRQDRYVINWGVGIAPQRLSQRELTWSNTPEAVTGCSDKISTFHRLSAAGVSHVEAAYARGGMADDGQFDELILDTVSQWLEQDGKIVVRHTVTGHSGAGIQIVRRGEDIPEAPLYTRYYKKQAEYRVHMFYGQPILIQQKRKQNGGVEDSLIRTRGNGWIFTVNNLSCDERGYRDELLQLAAAAGAGAVGANHCAVDILVKHNRDTDTGQQGMAIVEINSAPALEANSTLNAYVQAFRSKIAELNAQGY